MRLRVGVAVAVVCLLVTVFSAQANRGRIMGVITDTSGVVLRSVIVTLAGPEQRSVVSNERGEFTFDNLAPGRYTLRATLAGFVDLMRDVSVTGTGVERLRLQMAVGSLQETVTVSAEAPAARELAQSARARDGVPGGVPASVAGGFIGNLGNGAYRIGGDFDTETYDHIDEGGLRRVANDPLSTFSIDVDTASYANVRRFLTDGSLPPAGAVRIEELINYFRFDYPKPDGHDPFSVTTELAACPWNPNHRLALIGIRGRETVHEEPARRNLVFLLDVSGSMEPPDKLPLVRNAMRMLVDTLTSQDRIAIVVYAGASGLVLPSTRGNQKEVIRRALAQLEAGGSTNGAAGIRLAYQIAREHFVAGGVNRVILATDGDFNVGVTSQDELIRLIEHERESGVFLSVLGVGTGNLKDSTMEKLADKGNGNYAYLDSLQEARKVLVREGGATLNTIAKDVKIQVEFNPVVVAAYRLIGYENRALRNEDFNDDNKDAGEIGEGHTVTALYEIVPAGTEVGTAEVDPLRYQQAGDRTPAAASRELATVKLRYKALDGDASRLIVKVLPNANAPMSANLGFASAVAEFGMLLRDSEHKGKASYRAVAARARSFRGADPDGYRAEFIKLTDRAAALNAPNRRD
jgi:Ca-activated chloride channel family protein